MKLSNIILLLTASVSSSNAAKSFLRTPPTNSGVDNVAAAQQCLYSCADDAISNGQRGRPRRNRISDEATECASDCLPPALRDAETVACTNSCFREEARDIEREVERAIEREIRDCERDCSSEDGSEDERDCERDCERRYRSGSGSRSKFSSRSQRNSRAFERIEETARECLSVCIAPTDSSFAKVMVESNSNSNSNSNSRSSSSSSSSSSNSNDTRRAQVCLREPLINNRGLCEANRRCEWNSSERKCEVDDNELNFVESNSSNSNSNSNSRSSSSSSSSSNSNDTRRAQVCLREPLINNRGLCEANSRCEWNSSERKCEVDDDKFKVQAVTSFA